MGNIRGDLKVISFAVPSKLKKHLDKRIKLEGFSYRSDLLRRIVMDYLQYHISAEDLAEILAEIKKMEENRL